MSPDFLSQLNLPTAHNSILPDLKSEQISGSDLTSEITISPAEIEKVDLSKLRDFQLVLIERENFNLDTLLAKTVELNLGKSKSTVIRIESSEQDLKKMLSEFRFENPTVLDLLVKDLSWQTKIFGSIQDIKKTRVSVDFVLPIKYPPKTQFEGFHVDATESRCLCTLVGPGTEWVKEDSLVSDLRKNSSMSQKAKIIDKMDWLLPNFKIERISTGTVAIAKANQWIHRRPWSKQGRIFVTIDPT
jgi:hypothetical protein